jgi:hypothetical protein
MNREKIRITIVKDEFMRNARRLRTKERCKRVKSSGTM